MNTNPESTGDEQSSIIQSLQTQKESLCNELIENRLGDAPDEIRQLVRAIFEYGFSKGIETFISTLNQK